jgi:hypothetical protein
MDTVTYWGLEIKDWAVVGSTLLGPVLAVQAQKWIEAIKATDNRKKLVFEQLMATRSNRVSPEHVRALNMIDLVFNGSIRFGFTIRGSSEKKVLECWREYLDHLNNKSVDIHHWIALGDDLLTNLLCAIGEDVGYKFDRVHIKRGIYSPIAHGEIESELTDIRKGLLSLFKGESALKMNVVGFPIDKDALEANKVLLNNMNELTSDGSLKVTVKAESHQET